MGASKDDKDVFPSPPTPPTLIRRIAWALDSFSPSSLLPSWFWAPTPPQKCQGDHFGRNKGGEQQIGILTDYRALHARSLEGHSRMHVVPIPCSRPDYRRARRCFRIPETIPYLGVQDWTEGLGPSHVYQARIETTCMSIVFRNIEARWAIVPQFATLVATVT